MDDIYEKLLEELECPVCTNYMKPPIRQCETGHSVCDSCRNRLPKCPLCQGKFTASKNISLEALSCKMHYPCTNKKLGCDMKLSLTDIDNHEKNCTYKGFKCAMKKCCWIGKLEELEVHWVSKQTKGKMYTQFNVCHTSVKSDWSEIRLVKAYDKLFWYKIKLEKGNFFWAVQYLGNEEQANKYYYIIEIIKPGLSNQKITFTDYCQSIDISNDTLFKEDACITSNIGSFKRFIGENKVLIYYFKIFEDTEQKNSRKEFKQGSERRRDQSRGRAKLKGNSEKNSN